MRARVVSFVSMLIVALVVGLLQVGAPVPAASAKDKPYVPPAQKYKHVAHSGVNTDWPQPEKPGAPVGLKRRGPLPTKWTVLETAESSKPDLIEKVEQKDAWTGKPLATLEGPDKKPTGLTGQYRIGLADPQAAKGLAPGGLVFEVVAHPSADRRARFKLNYAELAKLGGMDWATRLQLVTLPACALTTPEKASCRAATPLADSRNDAAQEELSATLDNLAVGDPSAARSSTDGARVATAAATVVAAEPGPGGSQGSYLASSLQPSGSWSQGGSSGSFNWSYPINVTPSASGQVSPGINLSYSSSAVDGLNSNSNPQGSWAGLGFDYQPGYIERTFRNCKEQTPSSTDKGLCWAEDILTMHLPGGGTQALVVDDVTGEIRPKNDNGEKVERLMGASNGGVGGEYWRVTTTNGTRYTFGANILPGGTTTTATKSAWNVTVRGGTSGDGCASTRCVRTWRWNLDMVEDVHKNVAAYYYAKETNYFVPSGTTTRVAYDRGGYLTRIDYGITSTGTSIYSVANPPNRVTFTVAERCKPNSTITCTEAQFLTANQANWPDVPIDQNCKSSGTCNINWPTFWTRKRLSNIASSYYNGTAYTNVDSYALEHVWGTSSSTTTLNLKKITRTATAGGQTTTLPPVTLGYFTLSSRVSGYKSLPNMGYDRLKSIITETGAAIEVSYSSMDSQYNGNFAPHCTATSTPAQPSENSTSCYPVNWTQPFQSTPTLDYFHKYVVASVQESDSSTLTPMRKTIYKYSEPAWHFDDNEVSKPAQRTWSQWRGYRYVEVLSGDTAWVAPSGVADKQTRTATTYYLGESKDRLANGTTPTENLEFVDSQNTVRIDHDQFAGMVAETRTFDGTTEIASTRYIPKSLATTATRDRPNMPHLKAHVVATETTVEKTFGTGAGTTDLIKTTANNYEQASANEPFLQRISSSQVSAVGGTGSAPSTCTITTYANNVAKWVRNAPAEVSTYANPTASGEGCTGSDLLAQARNYYDGNDNLGGSNVTLGDVTKTEAAKDADGDVHYVTATRSYDARGRLKSTTAYPDGVGDSGTARTTTMAYTLSAGGQLTGVTTTAPNMTGITGEVTTAETYDPARGVLTRSTDIAGRVTSATFDALGRYTSVWRPGRTQGADTASVTYAYQLATNLPLAVTTKTLVDPGQGATPGYDTTVQILDSRGVLRQTQSSSATGGRVITDNFVDSHGWVVATNDRWYAGGAPSTGVITTGEAGVDSRTTTIYDGVGRPTKVRGWQGDNPQPRRTTTTIYGGDRTTVLPPTGTTATTTLSNGLGQTTELRRYTEPVTASTYATASNNKTTYSYTAAGAVRSMTTAVGTNEAATWTNTYDLLNRRVKVEDPDSGISTSTFDDTGSVTSTTDAADRTVSTTYDAWGRPTARYAGTPTTGDKLADWTYDTISRGEPTASRSFVLDEASGSTKTYTSTVVGYNAMGQPTGTDLTLDVPGLQPKYSTRATYTRTGLPATTTLASTRNATLNQGVSAELLEHWYSPLGLENGLTGTNVYLQNATYTPYREASQYVLAVNDATSAITYTRDPHHRWITNTLLSGQTAQPQVANVAAAYDASGNTTRTIDTHGGPGSPTQTTCYDYDSLQQLTETWTATDDCAAQPSESGIGGINPYWQSWAFDAAGSRKSQTIHVLPGQTGDDLVTEYSNGVNGHAHALAATQTAGESNPQAIGVLTDLPTASSMTYTPTGAADTVITPEGETTFAYRKDGSIRTVTNGDGDTTEYVNDANGSRLLRIDRTGSTTVTTLYLPGQQVRVSQTGADTTITTNRYYTLKGGQLIATRKNTANPVFTLTDPHGTANLTYDPFTNNANPPVTRRAHDPYGNELGPDTTPTPWLDDRTFLNKPLNPVTELVDLGARQYDPGTGRFLAVDPVLDTANATQANGYNYGNNNPVFYSDPTGTIPICQCAHLQLDPADGPRSHGSDGSGGGNAPQTSELDHSSGNSDEDSGDSVGDNIGNFLGGLVSGAADVGSEIGTAMAKLPCLAYIAQPGRSQGCADQDIETAGDKVRDYTGADENSPYFQAGYFVGPMLIPTGPPMLVLRLRALLTPLKLKPNGLKPGGGGLVGPVDIRPPLSISPKQLGSKWGKHASDYNLNPGSSASRTWFANRARNVHGNPSEVRRGAYNPSGGGGDNYFFFLQSDDLVITKPGGEFVTMFPGGSTNSWFKNAEVFPH